MAVGVNFNDISIHALLAEGDHDTYVIMEATKVIYIHALLAESDISALWTVASLLLFLSTLSLRRATRSNQAIISKTNNFYPRSPCGERPRPNGWIFTEYIISIHALLAESDPRSVTLWHPATVFLSTLSLRRATGETLQLIQRSPISIHALLAESDAGKRAQQPNKQISIHALLAESDGARHTSQQNAVYFYPRSPCGERLENPARAFLISYFYPRSPCGERQYAYKGA